MRRKSAGSATATAAGRTRPRAWLTAAVLLLLVSAGTFVAQSQRAVAAPGDFTVTPTTLDFGDVAVGYGSVMSVVVSNISATTQTPDFAGGAPSGIGFGGADSCAGVTLGPGESCNFHYHFQPNSVGVHTGTADIFIDGELFPITLTGNGVGVFPNTVAPTALDFGDVAVGDTSPPIDVIITNVGGATENPHVSGGFAPGNEFSRSNNCDGIVLDPGESCVVSYDFTPANVSAHNATATLNVHNGTFPITLTGNGVEAAPTSTTPSSDPGPTTVSPTCPTTEPTPSIETTSALAVDSTTTTTGESTTTTTLVEDATTSTSPGPIGPATVAPPPSTSSTSSSTTTTTTSSTTSTTSSTTSTTLPITTTTVNPCAPPPSCETTTTAEPVVTTPVAPTIATTPVTTTTTTTTTGVPIPAETTTATTTIASTPTSTTVPVPGDTRTTSTTIVVGVPTVTVGPVTTAPRIVVGPAGRSRPIGTAQAVPCVSPSTLPPTSFGQLPATGSSTTTTTGVIGATVLVLAGAAIILSTRNAAARRRS